MSEEKKVQTENEASVLRWIGALVLGLVLGMVFSNILSVLMAVLFPLIPIIREGGSWYELADYIKQMVIFAGFFWGLVLGIKIVAKTSMRAFVLGAYRKDKVSIKKEVLPILGFHILGLILATIPSLAHTSFSGKSAGEIVFLIAFSLLFLWMQTSFEEFLFRGFALRLVCRNKIGMNTRSLIAGLVTSLIFMAAHIINPEVQSLSGAEAVFQTMSYFVAGITAFLGDMLVGDLLPGLLIHFMNNFYCFVILTSAVSVGGNTSIWIDGSESSGLMGLFTTVISVAPVIIYLFVRWKKKDGTADKSES